MALLILKKEEITAGKIHSPVGRFAEWAKRGSAMAEGLRDALVIRNSATTKYPYRVALFA